MQKRIPSFSIKLRSTIFWGIVGGYTIPILITCIFIFPLNARIRHKVITTWTWVFNFCARHICGVKYEVLGRENLPKDPAIIASNHQSTWETLCFTQIFPQHVWVLKKELLKIPFFGWGLSFAAPISIDRSDTSTAMATILEQGTDRFKQGFWILTFPEGTRLNPGERKKYKMGTAKLAIALNSPIIPVAHNAGFCYPKGGLCMYPGKVTVKIGAPIFVETNSVEQLTHKLESSINSALESIGS